MSKTYLKNFFDEKKLEDIEWTLYSANGTPNIISNQAVIEHIMVAPKSEQAGIVHMLRKLDFYNADINDYLKHLAQALARDL